MVYADIERERVRARLWAHRDWDLVFLDEVASTQDVVRELAEARREFGPEPDKLIVVASHQTRGRGRQGHHWDQQPGTDISFSVLLHPQERYPGLLLPILVAAATWKALQLRLGPQIRIKWPNDLLIERRKLCGVLIESERPGSWIAGVGVNVNRAGFPPELEQQATSLARELGASQPRAEILADVLEALMSFISCAEQGDAETAIRTFHEGLGLHLEPVVVQVRGEEHFGRLSRVAPDGVYLDGMHFELGEVDAIRHAR